MWLFFSLTIKLGTTILVLRGFLIFKLFQHCSLSFYCSSSLGLFRFVKFKTRQNVYQVTKKWSALRFGLSLSTPWLRIMTVRPSELVSQKFVWSFHFFSNNRNKLSQRLKNLFHLPYISTRAEIHQALLSRLSLLAEFLIEKLLV